MKITTKNSQVKAMMAKSVDFSKMPGTLQEAVTKLGRLSKDFTEVPEKYEGTFGKIDKIVGEKAEKWLNEQPPEASLSAPKVEKTKTSSALRSKLVKEPKKKEKPTFKPKKVKPSPKTKAEYTTKQKVETSAICGSCQLEMHYIEVKTEEVRLLAMNNRSIIARKGDFILVNADLYPVTVIRRVGTTGKIIAKSVKMEDTSLEPEPKKPQSKPKKANPPKKEDKPASPKSKKRATCSLDADVAIPKVVKFLMGMAEDWDNSVISKKITKVFFVKRTNDVILEIADFKGFFNGLSTWIGGKRTYRRFCLESGNLTKAEKPAIGTYRLAISQKELGKLYSTKRNWNVCSMTYSALLACSMKGTCTASDKKKWRKLYYSCGDLHQKLKVNPKVFENYHVLVKRERKSGEKYGDAMRRVAIALKTNPKSISTEK